MCFWTSQTFSNLYISLCFDRVNKGVATHHPWCTQAHTQPNYSFLSAREARAEWVTAGRGSNICEQRPEGGNSPLSPPTCRVSHSRPLTQPAARVVKCVEIRSRLWEQCGDGSREKATRKNKRKWRRKPAEGWIQRQIHRVAWRQTSIFAWKIKIL